MKKVNRKLLEDIVWYHKALLEKKMDSDMSFKVIERYEIHKQYCSEEDFIKAYKVADRYIRKTKMVENLVCIPCKKKTLEVYNKNIEWNLKELSRYN